MQVYENQLQRIESLSKIVTYQPFFPFVVTCIFHQVCTIYLDTKYHNETIYHSHVYHKKYRQKATRNVFHELMIFFETIINLALYLYLAMRICEQASVSWQKCKVFCSNLNLFPSIPPTTDEHELRNQRLSTRLFIVCLFISLAILVSYTSLVKITKTINIKEPTLAHYSQLYTTHSQTLTCPCTQISINYGKFLHISYTLHQVCNSVFVTQNWFYYLNYQMEVSFSRMTFDGWAHMLFKH